MALDAYELRAHQEVEAWYAEQLQPSSNPLAAANRWINGGVSKALALPGLRSAVKALDPVLTSGFGAVSKTISQDDVVAKYESFGVLKLGDIASISLEHPDTATKHFGAWYMSTAALRAER